MRVYSESQIGCFLWHEHKNKVTILLLQKHPILKLEKAQHAP